VTVTVAPAIPPARAVRRRGTRPTGDRRDRGISREIDAVHPALVAGWLPRLVIVQASGCVEPAIACNGVSRLVTTRSGPSRQMSSTWPTVSKNEPEPLK